MARADLMPIKGAFDVTVQGISGLMSVTGEAGRPPVKSGVPVGDFCAGLYAAYTITAAVMQARRTGRGAYIDCSMLGALLGVVALQTSEYFGTGKSGGLLGSVHPRSAPYQAYNAKDERRQRCALATRSPKRSAYPSWRMIHGSARNPIARRTKSSSQRFSSGSLPRAAPRTG